jgi:hypothetical protein
LLVNIIVRVIVEITVMDEDIIAAELLIKITT